MSESLRAGAALTIITPPVGVDLCGFRARSGPSEGVHDDLRAAALCLEAGQTALLITADLIGLDAGTVAEVRQQIARATDVPAGNVMITCSHTHAGPATPCINYLGWPDPGYMGELTAKLAGVGIQAWAGRAEATWAAGRGEVRVGWNRREVRGGVTLLGCDPAGLCGRHVDVLRVDGPSGAPVALWMCHPAHAVAMRADNLLISGDWAGYAQRAVEAIYPGSVALFAQGCCGNINCDKCEGFDDAQRLGERLAEAVRGIAGRLQTAASGQVAAASEELALPLQDPPPVEQARAAHEAVVHDRDEQWEAAHYGNRMVLDGYVDWTGRILALAERGATGLSVPFEVQAIRAGDLCIVGLPGEVFVEYALSIDAASPCPLTAVPAYTNGNVGYVPTAAAFDVGGYEVETAIGYYGDTMLAPQCERLILDAAARVLERVCAGCGGGADGN
ncbi:MAG TPA: hypothetical protein VM283_02525 [Armatimonadota bacterium]|nr:hypothetical protein [Armatimonadota bacterium]